MDPTVVAALVGAVTTLAVFIIPRVQARRRKAKGLATGAIGDLIVPVAQSHALRTFTSLLPSARTVRMAGWSLRHVLGETRCPLRDLVGSGGTLKVLLLDPDSAAAATLDRNVSELDLRVRRDEGWPAVVPADIARGDIRKSLEILEANGLLRTKSTDIARVCTSLLPFGLLLVESKDGSGWLSVQIYPLHPDGETRHRLTFVVGSRQSPLWELLKDQFDAAWDDRKLSLSVPTASRGGASQPLPELPPRR